MDCWPEPLLHHTGLTPVAHASLTPPQTILFRWCYKPRGDSGARLFRAAEFLTALPCSEEPACLMKLGTWCLPKCSVRFLASGCLPSTPTPEHKSKQQPPVTAISGFREVAIRATRDQRLPENAPHPRKLLPLTGMPELALPQIPLFFPPASLLSLTPTLSFCLLRTDGLSDVPWLRPPPAPTAAFTFPSPSSLLPSLYPPPRHPSLPFPSPPASTPPLPPVACLHPEPFNAL
ncbi:fish-egg lectin-like [Platysternon megacephalum]|uniref:Fish-egg lectin-like n=1 Tax=Platysternon megacephalum TaxID=55544 RepID=A0A4D9DJ76_9SAUR|nr:fish-egg lectin-like [Platysternon megacephalum]